MHSQDLREYSSLGSRKTSAHESLSQVYTLPPHLTLPASTISQCRWSAYSSELLLHSLLTTPSSSSLQQTYVTSDPSQADLFFIPLFPSCYLFDCWVKAGWNKTERCGVDEDYIQPVMAWVREQGFWDANSGADHIITHPMDFADGYYTETSRAAMNSSIYLVTVGDLRPPPFSQHYRRHRDIVIPSATHLLNSYFINPMDYLDALGHPLATPASRTNQPIPTRVEIFEPSPTSMTGVWGARPNLGLGTARDTLKSGRGMTAIFRGGLGQPHEGEGYALGIRSLFFPSPPSSHSGFSSLPLYDLAESSSNDEYALALSRAKYGLVPPGYTLDTTRVWEYLAFGVVPVFLGAGPTAGQVMPFADDFDYAAFSISIPRERAHDLPRILDEVGEEEYERLRRKVWETGRLLVLEEGRGNVWRWIVRDLCRMRGIGTNSGSDVYWEQSVI